MGNSIGKSIGVCFNGGAEARRAHKPHDFYFQDQYDEGLGHSFCYVRPDNPTRTLADDQEVKEQSSIFRSISGASVSANTSTPPLTYMDPAATSAPPSGPLFESSNSFAAVSLCPIPRSGPLPDRGFLSGPMERAGGFLSGPLDRAGPPAYSGPLDRSFSHHSYKRRRGKPRPSLIKGLRRAISRTFGHGSGSVVAPVKGMIMGQDNWVVGGPGPGMGPGPENTIGSETSLDEMMMMETWGSEKLQWAQGKAGEDRVHVVVSEEHGWVFVGIYDGFNGPDATDFLLSNLYTYVQKELKGLLWDDRGSNSGGNIFNSKSDYSSSSSSSIGSSSTHRSSSSSDNSVENNVNGCCCDEAFEEGESVASSLSGESLNSKKKGGRKYRGGGNKKWGENQRRWKCEWDRERIELDKRLREQWDRNDNGAKTINHSDVLKALGEALRKTEEAYFDIADKMLDENPELSLMGSCVLAMLMKGEDVYVMNVGDSRAVLAQNKEVDLRIGKVDQDLERINEESFHDFDVSDGVKPTLCAYQLTMDHSTCVDEEVVRVRQEHPEDPFAVMNDRVKGSLKVTRAFGAGFLKQPKWNDALLEMFRIDYIGTSPYINCLPSLYHHRLGPKDQFLVLSSDGLYQYFTNDEAVAEVELFISLNPEGDPAQHLVEEVLIRAAKKAGMDFYELLEIPQGDRRRYHDDVSIIIISFEGRIWRSCV